MHYSTLFKLSYIDTLNPNAMWEKKCSVLLSAPKVEISVNGSWTSLCHAPALEYRLHWTEG